MSRQPGEVGPRRTLAGDLLRIGGLSCWSDRNAIMVGSPPERAVSGCPGPDAAQLGVIVAGANDVNAISQVISEAFHDVPQSQQVIPMPCRCSGHAASPPARESPIAVRRHRALRTCAEL